MWHILLLVRQNVHRVRVLFVLYSDALERPILRLELAKLILTLLNEKLSVLDLARAFEVVNVGRANE